MRRYSSNIFGNGLKRFKKWLRRIKPKRSSSRPDFGKLGGSLRNKIPKKIRQFDFDFQGINLKNVSEHSTSIRWGLTILTVFLLAQITAGIIGLFVRPTFPKIPQKRGGVIHSNLPQSDLGEIERRNIFNVEGTIPEPFETGLLECMSQAKPSAQPITLLGTIVMDDERFSTALVQMSGNTLKIGVKKDEWFFDGKYLAMSIERKKLCFQVRSTQELEYVEIPEKGGNLASSPSLSGGYRSSMGITPLSETKYEVKRNFLDEKLLNLNEILQTAKAVPYLEPGTGQFKGFLVQSIEQDSPFAELGIRQGDILTGVNEIQLDNPGKGLEAFKALKNSTKIDLKIIRGGRQTSLNYKVN